MDWLNFKERGGEGFKKYRMVLLVLLAGIFLMVLPGKKETAPVPAPQPEQREECLEEALSALLSHLSGAGKVEVLLTEAAGAETIFQTDEDRSAGETTTDIRRETVLVTSSSREETGLIRRIDPPTYQGAIVLAQGAGDPKVKLSLVEAVANATGLTTDKITVLKMK